MSRSFVTDAVVATLERLGRGSCADIERWGGIAEGASRATQCFQPCGLPSRARPAAIASFTPP